VNYPRRSAYRGQSGALLSSADDYLRRIAEAVERIADAVAGPPAAPASAPSPTYPVIDWDDHYQPSVPVAEPHIACSAGRLYYAVCVYCPSGRGQTADPAEPSTWLDYAESSFDLDEQRHALARHLSHHERQADPTMPLPIWTWSDRPCPRCQAPAEQRSRTRSGRTSAVHAERWQDHSTDYW
jgi:hypothetical protein